MAFAEKTSVPAERTRGEIEKWLRRGGADQCNSGWSTDKAVVAFRMQGRFVRIEMPLVRLNMPKGPNLTDGKWRTQDGVDQENRRRWRALLLYIRAKLESVESGIMIFEDAFMAHMVLPNGETVSKFMRPQIESAYKDGKMPKALPGY
jgi:hypothetical protein